MTKRSQRMRGKYTRGTRQSPPPQPERIAEISLRATGRMWTVAGERFDMDEEIGRLLAERHGASIH
jgi:hypothetical protein